VNRDGLTGFTAFVHLLIYSFSYTPKKVLKCCQPVNPSLTRLCQGRLFHDPHHRHPGQVRTKLGLAAGYAGGSGGMTRIYHSRRLAAMHAVHGVTEGKRCGQCAQYNRKGLWCRLNGSSSCQWATNWKACGRWEARA
jgi:hypothetical protein